MDMPLVHLVHDHHVIPGEVRVRGQLPQEETCEGGRVGRVCVCGVCVCVCVCVIFKLACRLPLVNGDIHVYQYMYVYRSTYISCR